MMPSAAGSVIGGEIRAVVTEGQRTPEQWAAIAAAKMIQVADGAPPVIRDQARAFKVALMRVMANYIRMAVEDDRAFLAANFERGGHADLARIIRNR